MTPEVWLLLGLELPATAVVSLGITLLVAILCLLTRALLQSSGLSLWQVAVESFYAWIVGTVREVVDEDPAPYVPLIAGLMLFIAISNLLAVVPFIPPPTGDLATAVALALVVFVAVPAYGIRRLGLGPYLRSYARPSVLLLPLNLIGEVSRTLALAVRLFGNVMSGQMIGAILLVVGGAVLPVPLMMLSVLTGLIQAYIFGILAAVYIAAALQVGQRETPRQEAT